MESDDILVFIYKNCASNNANEIICPWQVNFPANDDTTKSLYYNGSDDIITDKMLNMQVEELIIKNSTIQTNIHLNVEVAITGRYKTYFVKALTEISIYVKTIVSKNQPQCKIIFLIYIAITSDRKIKRGLCRVGSVHPSLLYTTCSLPASTHNLKQ